MSPLSQGAKSVAHTSVQHAGAAAVGVFTGKRDWDDLNFAAACGMPFCVFVFHFGWSQCQSAIDPDQCAIAFAK